MKKLSNIDLSLLSKKRRLVLQYAIDYPNKVVLMRMEELANQLDVDPTTIVKACKAVGLMGFHELKELLKKEVRLTRIDSVFGGMIKDIESHTNPQKMAQDAILGDIMMLRKTYESLDMVALEKTANLILTANRTYIIGLGHLGLIAKYMERIFRSLVPNVQASTEYHGELFSNMVHFSERDIIIGIGLDKCQHQTFSALKYAKEEKNASTVCIVDSAYSPLIAQSDYSIIINSTNSKYFGSMIGAFSIGSAIFHMMAALQKTTAVNNFQFFRKMSAKEKTYL